SGFVLCICICEVDEAWGEVVPGQGLADTRFCRKAHTSTGGQDPSAVARARCQGNGSLPLDGPPPRPILKLTGRKDGLQRTVRRNLCRRRRLNIRTDCRVARFGLIDRRAQDVDFSLILAHSYKM